MTGKGALSTVPNRRMRWMLVIQLLWAGLVSGIVLWWRSIMIEQAEKIGMLEASAGIKEGARSLDVTLRMLWWESNTALVLLLSLSVVLFWLYWRDARRARSIQAFFASVTHELRTPLTSIRLQAESIADSVEGSGEETQRLISRLLEDTQRLESQVERTLELARVEGGGPVHLQVMELRTWFSRLAASLGEAYAGRVRVLAEIPDSAVVQADPAALQVILRNLIENSMKHSGCDPVEVRVGASAAVGGRVVVVVSDNGEGYGGDIKSLGALFNRGKGSAGAGVGLYLVRVLMERMGGRVEYLSSSRGFETRLEFKESVL
jgi:signal transduction histidine kinase